MTVNTSSGGTTENIYICLGYRLFWDTDDIEELGVLLQGMGAQRDGSTWRYRNQSLNKEFVIHFVQDMNSMKLALQEEGAHVLFKGHANYGLGPVFATDDRDK